MWRIFLLATFLTACALNPSTPTLPAIPRPHTALPTADTPQPPTPASTPTFIFPKEKNSQIAAPMWNASNDVLREFKNTGGTVLPMATKMPPKLNTRTSTIITLDGKVYRRALSVLELPMQFIGTRVFSSGGYRAPVIGELATDVEAVVLYFVDLTTGTVRPLIFTLTYAGKIAYGGYSWLTLNSDFFEAIPKFSQPAAQEIPPLLQKQIGKQFWVSPVVWMDLETATLLNTQYAQHSLVYKAEAVRSATCSSPTLQKLIVENLTTLTPTAIWETFKNDGALPPCIGLISQ